MKMAPFKREQRPGEQPHYVYRGKEAEVEIYYGEPTLAQRGVYALIRITESGKVLRVLLRQLDQFDATALAAVADNFYMDVE